MSQHSSNDRPAGRGLFFMVIGFSFVLGLYALLALPGYGNSTRGTWMALKSLVQADAATPRPNRVATVPN